MPLPNPPKKRLKVTEKDLSQNDVIYCYTKPGPGCSKLTTSLVNVSLSFER